MPTESADQRRAELAANTPSPTVSGPLLALELETVESNGDVSRSSGFLLLHANSGWIVSCLHGLDSGLTNLQGRIDAFSCRVRQPDELSLWPASTRRVVGARVGGEVVDFVAFELRPGDLLPTTPALSLDLRLPGDGGPVGGRVLMTARLPDGTYEQRDCPLGSMIVLQGYTNVGNDREGPTTYLAAASQTLAAPFPWMFAYYPGGRSGLSGGPVLRLGDDGYRLAGVHTHGYVLESHPPQGFDAPIVEVLAGAAVGIETVIAALERAGGGVGLQLIDLE